MSSYRLGTEEMLAKAERSQRCLSAPDVYVIEVKFSFLRKRNLLNFKPEFIIRLRALNSTTSGVIDRPQARIKMRRELN